MSVLRNPRHERFAQELAKGETADRAYQQAGYRPDRAHAARLAANGSIRGRLDEIQCRAAQQTEETVVRITADLREMYLEAQSMVRSHGPAAVVAATRALMDIAKLNGLLVERTHNTHVRRDVRDFTDAELLAILNEKIAEATTKLQGSETEAITHRPTFVGMPRIGA